jgi:hypothetical protein
MFWLVASLSRMIQIGPMGSGPFCNVCCQGQVCLLGGSIRLSNHLNHLIN